VAAIDSLKQKIRKVREQAAGIEARLSVPDGSVLSVDQLRAGIDEVMDALIEMGEIAEVMERNYAAAIEFLNYRGFKPHGGKSGNER
jgi:hypothetical protein